MRRFSRHGLTKAVSFLLAVACVVTLALTFTLYDRRMIQLVEYSWNLDWSENLAGVEFENSGFLSRVADNEYSQLVNGLGWYADTKEEAIAAGLRYVRENESQHILYRIKSGYLTAENTDLSVDDLAESLTYTYHEDILNYAREDWSWEYDSTYYEENKGEIWFSLTESYTEYLREVYAWYGRMTAQVLASVIPAGLILLVCILHLLLTCGRKGGEKVTRPYSEGVVLSSFWDRPWLDAALAVAILPFYYTAQFIHTLYWRVSGMSIDRAQVISGVISGVLVAIWAAAGLWWLLSAMKRVKDRSILRHTLTYVVLSGIFKTIWRRGLKPLLNAAREALAALPTIGKSAVCTGIVLLTALFFIVGVYYWDAGVKLSVYIVLLVFAGHFLYKALCLAKLAAGLKRLSEGDYSTPAEEKGPMRAMARDLNAATGGLKIAVEKELTGQRLKNELITNVSHDLRTPLTSIITYADLLENEGLDSPDAKKYLEIIRRKARRLAVLTEDLFEASKASSGETQAVLAPLDLAQLIEQSLGEISDRLRAVPLEVRVSGGCGAVLADGRLLCRVFENLLRNIEKYALPGTRVYIDTTAGEFRAAVTLRNISAAPLESGSDHLFERFTRGDEARSTEGSGLGLAIVKSFMELQNGSCSLAADGDLFKVTLTLPLADTPLPPAQDAIISG